MTASRFVRLTLVLNLVAVAVASVICLLTGGVSFFAASLVGGLVGAINLFIIGRIAMRMFSSGDGRRRMILLLGAKTALLFGGTLAMTLFLGVSSVGIAAGFSASVVAVLAVSLYVVVCGHTVEL